MVERRRLEGRDVRTFPQFYFDGVDKTGRHKVTRNDADHLIPVGAFLKRSVQFQPPLLKILRVEKLHLVAINAETYLVYELHFFLNQGSDQLFVVFRVFQIGCQFGAEIRSTGNSVCCDFQLRDEGSFFLESLVGLFIICSNSENIADSVYKEVSRVRDIEMPLGGLHA